MPGILGHVGSAAQNRRLLDEGITPETIRLIGRLWLYPPIIIALSMPLGFVSVYPVYILWFLMPVISYGYSTLILRRKRQQAMATEAPSARRRDRDAR